MRLTSSLFLSLLLSFYFSASAQQLSLKLGEHYLAGENVIKLQVSPEDYTIWALTATHKIYYKKDASADFELFTPVTGMQVNDMAGYNFNDMYFVVDANILAWCKNGSVQTMTVPNPLVTKINGIAIISPAYNTSSVDYTLRDGWLAIGTNDNLYSLKKGTSNIMPKDQFLTTLTVHHDSWDYLRSGFKGATFRYNYPYDYCAIKSTHNNTNLYNYTDFVTAYPDLPPMPAKINTGLMSLHPMNIFSGGGYSYNRTYDFWGTDQGLYIKPPGLNCSDNTPPIHFFNEPVNGLSEAYALAQISAQHYMFAATNSGLQYTPSTFYSSDYAPSDPSVIKFVPFTDFPNIKATDVLVDSRKDDEVTPFIFVCDRVAWVSTISGIYKIYMSYDNDKFKDLRLMNFAAFYGQTPQVFNSDGDAVYNRCNNNDIIKAGLINHANTSLLIKWYKGSSEITAWQGQQIVELQESGKYHAEITSLCEGLIIKSINFILQPAADAKITFNYPDNITLCEGETYTLTTDNIAGYKYKWYNNNQPINGATGNTYQVNDAGQYHVEVSNCDTYYKASKDVTFSIKSILTPTIVTNKDLYCTEDIATLKVDNPAGYTVKWYLNGSELTAFLNANSISVQNPGIYTVKFISGTCEKSSAPCKLTFTPPINFDIIKSKQQPLCFNETISLTTSIIGDSYKWSTGETARNININTPGHYSVEITTAGYCPTTKAIDITGLPPVDPALINDGLICTIAHETLKITAPPGFAYYTWNGIKGTNSVLNVNQPGNYTLVITTSDGCTATTTFNIKAWCKEIIIPNTFTPNNDGINDYWRIGGLEGDADARVQIFNRYGAKLLDYRIIAYQWDGSYKGQPLPMGTYYYIIETQNSNSPLKGAVTIIR